MNKTSFFVLVKLLAYEYQLSLVKNMFSDFIGFKEYTKNKLKNTLPIETMSAHSQIKDYFLEQETAYIFQRLEHGYAIDYPWHSKQRISTINQLFMLTYELFQLERSFEKSRQLN